MSFYTDGFWWSNDNLRLHYRDYGGADGPGSDKPPILCIPGLTRNCRDWEPVAARLASHWRVITLSLRGRGESAYAKDPLTYVPVTYLQDIGRLLIQLEIKNFVAFGTSLGGIVSMLVAATYPERLVGALLNDIGPKIEEPGLARIKNYVGKLQSWPTWMHSARALADSSGDIYPDYTLEQWLAMSKRLYQLNANGRVVPDYDPAIALPFTLPVTAQFDLWPALAGLRDVPTLIVRGALSDILSAETADEMAGRLPNASLLTVPNVGHAPVLDEPVAVAAIDALLATIVAQSVV